MKILTLRIYNSTPDYDEMYKIHKDYDKNSIYVTASPDISAPTYNSTTNILIVPGKESIIPGILNKTIEGIRYCMDHFDFDILIRSNMSTVIDYNELETQLKTIDNPYGGHIWIYDLGNSMFNFVSGCCLVMNRDICKYLVSNKDKLIYELNDDVAIGRLLSYRFPITFVSQYKQTNIILPNTCFYRFRNDLTRYDKRENDIENMRRFYLLSYVSRCSDNESICIFR